MDGIQPSAGPEFVTPLRIAETGGEATDQSSMTLVRLKERVYRIEYWSDGAWQTMPPETRPEATPAHSGDGWFLVTLADSL